MADICVIGLGYIGLPTALTFARHGKRVAGVDVSAEVCETINKGSIHIVEPGLAELAQQVHETGLFTTSRVPEESDAFIIAVPTPLTKDKKADLSYVKAAAAALAEVLRPGNLVVLESTVPPRTTLDVLVPELEKSGLKPSKDFLVAHCPERVLPGWILQELIYNNRIIGGIDEQSAKAARDLYTTFVKGEMFLTSSITAELCKLMENTYRDVNIALANELAMLSENYGADAWEVITLANRHPRVNLHQPGPGVGGHCLAVDPWFIVEAQPEVAQLIKQARDTNDAMPHHIARLVTENTTSGGKVALLGITYKANIDDMRESPVIKIRKELEEHGFEVVAYEPHIVSEYGSVYEAATGADTTVLCVNHALFSEVDFDMLASIMRGDLIIDVRNFLSEKKVRAAGLRYLCLGKG